MANYINNSGQIRLGWRSPVVVVSNQPTISASLLQSLYGVWNGDTTTNELDKSLFGAWNAENSTNTLDNSVYSVFTDLTTYTNTGLTNSQTGLWDAEGLGLNDKVGTNHLTSFGSATFSTDTILGTKSFTFTTATQYFGLPINSWNFTGDFSVSFWAKATWGNSCIPISNCVWSQTTPTIKYSGWQVGFTGAKPYFYGVSGGTASFSVSSAVDCVSNSWSNVVVTKSNNVVSIYVNGFLGGTSSVTGNITYATTSYPSIGAQKYSSTGVSDHAGLHAPGCKFDNISTWTRVLSHDDVIALYNSGSGQSYPYTQPVTISVDKSQSLTGFVVGTGSSVVSGKTGNAISLTQSTSIILKDISAMRFTGDFSVSFWFKTPDVTTGKALISRHDGQRGWYVYIAGGNILWASGGSVGVAFGFNSTTLVANTWYHVAVSLTNNVDVKCYLNGVLGGQNSMVSKTITYDYWTSYHPVVIGGRANNNGSTIYIDYRYTGIIDDMVVWTRPITQNEVNQLYNGTSGVEYPYSGKSLSSPNDNFGTNHGTLMNGCSFAIGKIGNAFTFDGVNDYVSFPTDSWNSLVGTDLTISLWVKFASTGNQTLISNMSAPGVNIWNGWEIRISSGQPIFYSWNNTGNTNGVIGSSVTTNTWYHIVATKRGNSYKIYMNGSLTSTGSGTGNAIVNASFYPNIGHLQYSSSFHANYTTNGTLIDAVNLWNREITADEVTQLYNSGTGAQYPFTGTFSSAGNQLGVDNGTLMNGCYLSDGKIGKAFTFDGVNDYVQLPDNSLNFTGDFSFSFWIYNDNMPLGVNRRYIGSSYYSGSGTYGFGWTLLRGSDNVYRFQLFNGDSNPNSLFSSNMDLITINEWTHIVVTRKRSTQTKIYKNGVDVTSNFSYTLGSNTINCGYNSTQYCTIGALKDNNTSTFGYIKGKMDSVLVYQKELTQSEVTELYNSGNGKQITATPIVQTGLILNLDASRKSSYTGTGTTWTDISGNSKNGTIFNSPIFGTAGDGSFLFNASNQQIRVGSVTSGLTLTYNMWIRLSTISQQMLFWDGSSADGNDFWTTLTTDGKIRTLINNTTYLTSNSSITANTWYNVSIVTTSTGKSIYINGVLDSTDNTPILTRTGYSYLSIGYAFDGSNDVQGWMGGTNLRGNIGSFNIYNRSLSATEVLQNFNATKSRFGL